MSIDFFILCGGLGTRLQSVSGGAPKVMAEVQGEPFLDFLIRYLIKQGARRIILCAGYKAEALAEHYKAKFREITIEMSIEPAPLGTGGAFKNAEKYLQSDMLFGLNGDCFTPLNYADMLQAHLTKQSVMTLAGVRVNGNKDFGTIVMNQQDEIVTFREKFETSEVQYISAGIYCFNRSVFDMMPQGKFSIEYDLFPKMIGNKFFGFRVAEPFIDIGTPERFEWAKKNLGAMLDGKADIK